MDEILWGTVKKEKQGGPNIVHPAFIYTDDRDRYAKKIVKKWMGSGVPAEWSGSPCWAAASDTLERRVVL